MSIGKSNRGSDVGHGAWLCCAHVLPRGQTLSSDEWQCQLMKFTMAIITFFHTHSSMMIRLHFLGDQEWLETARDVHSRRLHVIAARPSGKESATAGSVELPGHSSEGGIARRPLLRDSSGCHPQVQPHSASPSSYVPASDCYFHDSTPRLF
jgi:hypothetical protein